MKIFAPATSLLLAAALVSQSVHADAKRAQDIQAVTTFSAVAILGGIAAGPIGLIAGVIGGVYLTEKAKNAVATKDELLESQMAVTLLETKIEIKEEKLTKLEYHTAKKLEFQVMFPTGIDTLSSQDSNRLESLSSYLHKNPTLKVRLDGHTDPRGTDEYNNVLSEERAASVATALFEHGITKKRIEIYSHGSSNTRSSQGNYDEYALERRVNIKVYTPSKTKAVASSH